MTGITREFLEEALVQVEADQGGFHASLTPTDTADILRAFIALQDEHLALQAKFNRAVSCR